MAKRREAINPPTEHTKGPWRWYGNTRNDEVYLAAPWGGRHLVMAFRRWGMANAQPCFYAYGLRHDVGEFVEYERDYRDDVIGINHPDARLIAAAPELFAALKAVVSSVAPCQREHPAMWDAWQEAIRVIRSVSGKPQADDAADPSATKQENGPRA